MTWTTTVNVSTGGTISSSDHNAQVLGNLDHLYDNLPSRATIWHDESTVTNGNAIAVTLEATHRYGWYAQQSAAADGDIFTQTVVLVAGTYTMYLFGGTNANSGKIDWTLDGTSIATAQDWYSAGATYNVEKTIANIVITEGGRKVLIGTVNGKNAGSGDYFIRLTKMWFKQATDT